MADVFVSYKRQERKRVEPVVAALQAAGRSVWWDSKTQISAQFLTEINSELNQCNCVLVVWSKQAVVSDFVKSEAYFGYEKRKLVPVRLDDAALDVPFNVLQTADLSRWQGDAADPTWRAVLSAVNEFCGMPAQQAGSYRKRLEAAAAIAPDDAALEQKNTAKPADRAVRDRAKALVLELLDAAKGDVASGRVGAALRQAFPEHVTNFDWFGQSSFREFFKSLALKDIEFQVEPPGRIRRTEGKAGHRPAAKTVASVAETLFETIDIPAMNAQEFTSCYHAIANAIKGGARTITDISKVARDNVQALGLPISRYKITYILKGALFGGLKPSERTYTPIEVGIEFARKLRTQCGAAGWYMDDVALREMLALVGLPNVSPAQLIVVEF